MKEEINVLDELNKGSCMGKDAIYFVYEKTKDSKLKDYLNVQLEQYQKMIDEINALYKNYVDDKKPHKTNAINKVMTWYGIEIRTLMDNSTSKIAELLLQGTNMGIIEGRKLLNNKNIDKKVSSLVQKYVDFQEESVEKLKQFL